MEDCIFCKIINGEIPSAKIYEDDLVYAFLDLGQVTPGHSLVIPKVHRQDIFEYDSELAGQVFSRIPMLAKAIQSAFPEVQGMNIIQNNGAIAYQSVFHSHIHLIPRYHRDEGFSMSFTDNSSQYSQAEFQERADLIKEALNKEA